MQLTAATQASVTAQSGVAFAQQPAIQVRDASGNPVNQAGVVVTAAIATGGGAVGGAPTATTARAGVASLKNFAIRVTALGSAPNAPLATDARAAAQLSPDDGP